MSATPRQELDAVYEGGVFRPVVPAGLPEGARVHLILEPPQAPAASPLELVLRVYEDLSPQQIEEVERIALDRSRFMVSPAEL